MEIIYNNKQISKSNNDFLKINETQKQPEIKLDVDKTKTYLLIMYDPDAVLGTHIHWILSNIKNNNINTGIDLIKYKGPAPPPHSGKHRYIFELYEQKIPHLNPIEDRTITIEKLRDKLDVNQPINKIQFISQNESGGRRRKTKKRKNKKRKTKRKNISNNII
jgi:phosphatidylethanolamine-binding protein (PEBP) family uncharacterized protein